MLISVLFFGCIIHSVTAEIFPIEADVHRRDTNHWPGGPSSCVHSKRCRQSWSASYDIHTDTEKNWPNTRKIVYYNLNITTDTLAPDGIPRNMMVINGQYPGPVLTAGKQSPLGMGEAR